MRRIRGLLVVAVLTGGALWPAGAVVAGGGCHGGTTQGSGDTVAMSKLCFTPSVLHVEPGTEVTFVNNDPLPHNISSEWGSSEDMQKGDRFTATFAEEGTYPYACTYHYGMTGAVIVGDGDGPGSGASVEPGALVDTTPISEERAASPQTSESPLLGWVVSGAVGVLLGAGLTGLLRRRPEEA